FVFKKKVVSDYLNNEGGYKYLAHKYQINRTLVRHWVRIYNYHTTGITKKYGAAKALDKVSIEIKRGMIYGLIGENGAGKSTFMRT
ncbi:ATP-binding cassette domain-containing protein, partial [Enterococcus faecium]|uniref:ATP-binding cassette domain-containing protein n=1 Tax=Enterococcus faecium TaxID=1352 RepID=UPI00292F6543